MEIQKMKDLLKDHNHILIDYSDKFIDTDGLAGSRRCIL